MTKQRRTPNSKLSTRGYRIPKWFAKIFQVKTFETEPAQAYSGLNALKRIITDIQTNDKEN